MLCLLFMATMSCLNHHFKSGTNCLWMERELCANVPRSGRSASMRNATSIEKVDLMLCNDRRQLIRDITDNTGIN